MRTFITICAIGAASLMLSLAVNPVPVTAEADSVSLGPATGDDDDGNPNEPTEAVDAVGIKPGGATSSKLIWDITNDTGKDLTDIHVKLIKYKENDGTWQDVGDNFKITAIETAEIDDDTSHMTGTASGQSADADASAGETLGKGKELKVAITVADKDGNDVPADREFKVEITGTELDETVSNTSTDEIGTARPREILQSLNIPNFTPGTKLVSPSSGTATLNDIALAECDDFRFDEGSIVLTPDSSTTFFTDGNTEVLIYNENGDEASVTMAEATNLRTTSGGGFAFDLDRYTPDTNHVVLVIRGLGIEGLNHDLGDEIECSAGGAALGSGYLEDNWTIVEIGNND